MHLSDLGEPWREIAEVMRAEVLARIQSSFKKWEESAEGTSSISEEEMLAGLVIFSEIEVGLHFFFSFEGMRQRMILMGVLVG